jgi:hypothetical protein
MGPDREERSVQLGNVVNLAKDNFVAWELTADGADAVDWYARVVGDDDVVALVEMSV